jgi:tRNA A37 methylthiotransferase MiaB
VLIETYGCQMNVSDSEIISSVLTADQYSKASSVQEAGVVLLNTCAIRWASLAAALSCKACLLQPFTPAAAPIAVAETILCY